MLIVENVRTVDTSSLEKNIYKTIKNFTRNRLNGLFMNMSAYIRNIMIFSKSLPPKPTDV